MDLSSLQACAGPSDSPASSPRNSSPGEGGRQRREDECSSGYDELLAMSLQGEEISAERERMEQSAAQGSRWSWLSRTLSAAGDLAKLEPRVLCGGLPSDDEVDASRSVLEERIAVYGMQEVPVEGDGNCQFRALAHGVYGRQSSHGTVRALVCAQLRSFAGLYREHVPGDYEVYCRDMARPGTWGDHVTLQAAADAYGVRIVMLTSYPGAFWLEIEPRATTSEATIMLSFWAEYHYNALRMAPEFEADIDAQRKQPAREAAPQVSRPQRRGLRKSARDAVSGLCDGGMAALPEWWSHRLLKW